MIPNQWYVILESNEVKPGKPVGLTRMGERLVLWRDAQGRVCCMSDLCPHRGVALSAGKLVNGNIECPFHGFQYDTSGRCQLVPANGKNAAVPKAFQVQRAYPTREAHGFIYIWWGEPAPAPVPEGRPGDRVPFRGKGIPGRQDLPPLPFFDSVDDTFSYATLRDHWATHYSRAIENQLDVVHLPFVHYNTIGRGNRTLINGPLARMERRASGGDLISLWVYNEVDEGQTPLKPSEIQEPQRRPFVQFQFPNLWHNWISDDTRIIIAFAPIDDENTLMYIRFYQKAVKAPVLRELFNLMGKIGNLVIERQDKRVVITQRPKRSELRIGEKLIQGDGPIIEYRRRRLELSDDSRRQTANRSV